MKSERIYLAKWQGNVDEEHGAVDIPWPKVHQLIGNEQIRWIQNQGFDRCQLVLDTTAAGVHKLYAEFYDHTLRVEYALRFAK